jgi:hypothetical protein
VLTAALNWQPAGMDKALEFNLPEFFEDALG